MRSAIIKLRGGHSIHLRDASAHEVVDTLAQGRRANGGDEFYFFANGTISNAVAVKPNDVVAVIKGGAQ